MSKINIRKAIKGFVIAVRESEDCYDVNFFKQRIKDIWHRRESAEPVNPFTLPEVVEIEVAGLNERGEG